MIPEPDGPDARRSTSGSHWIGVELRHLVALRAIALERSFGRAAQRLGFTQSAISQQLSQLEENVRHRLVDRGQGRPVALTEAGAIMLRHTDAILGQLDAAEAELTAHAAGTSTLRVGVFESVGTYVLPVAVRRFARAQPRVAVEICECANDAQLLALLEHGMLDATFVVMPVREGPFASVTLFTDRYVLLVAADSPLRGLAQPPSLDEIAALPLIDFNTCREPQRAATFFRSRGLEPNVVFHSDSSGTILGLVAAGVASAVVPQLAARPHDGVAVVELGDRFPQRVLGIAWHRNRGAGTAVRAFVEAALATAAAGRNVLDHSG